MWLDQLFLSHVVAIGVITSILRRAMLTAPGGVFITTYVISRDKPEYPCKNRISARLQHVSLQV
jgi:hypothetical protein